MKSAAFDVIFAGGGTTACVIAGRLADLDRSLKILIIESGPHSRDVPQLVQPCRYVERSAPNSTTLSVYIGRQSTYLNGRSPVVSCGRGVGGGSTVNSMLYVRGAASDYDDWAALGNEGWSFHELLPFIRKLETFAPISDVCRTSVHGDSGPIKISATHANLDVGRQFLNVAKEYDPVRPQVDDHNDFSTANAYCPAYQYIHPATGKRSDAASSYLYPPHANSPNVTIVVGRRVKRVLVENGRAVGVEHVADSMSSPAIIEAPISVNANKVVVVSSRAFGSPAILERSGIGAQSVLKQNDIPVLVDLPGVGENYRDHIAASWVFYGSDQTETMNEVWCNPEGIVARLKEWEQSGTGKVAHNGIEAVMKVRPTEEERKSAGPALQKRWETYFQNKPDKPMGIIAPISGFASPTPISTDQNLLSVVYYILYPESIGSIHITSGEDVDSPPDFDPDFLTKAGDVTQLTLLYKMSRELVRRMPCYRGEAAAFHPHFPVGSPAACKEKDLPSCIGAQDIVYSDQDNEAIVNFHRDRARTIWHSLGTCAMKPRNQGGVVDARLNVYGVAGLKVADMSICPTNVGNNTYSTALLIGEKAAAIIADDLGYTHF